MDQLQIREHVTDVLDKLGVLSRIKAELRASVFSAIHHLQGGPGLGGKSNPARRRQLAADASGELLVELLRECLEWCHLPFTLQVFEQEMQLGRGGPTLASLRQCLGLAAADQAAGPLLLQLLKVHQGHASAAAAAGAGADHGLPDTHAKQQAATGGSTAPPVPVADSAIDQQPTWQLPSPHSSSRGPSVAPAVGGGMTAGPAAAAGAIERLSMSASVVADSSLIEESGLMDSSARDEELLCAIFVPRDHATAGVHRGSDDSAGGGEQAGLGGSGSNSSSSTSSVDTPRQLSRPVRGPALQAALPALAAAASPLAATAPTAAAATKAPDVSEAGTARATFELSESFGERSSLADSSYELHGADSPAAPSQPAARFEDPQSCGGSSSSSSAASSRSLSRRGSGEGSGTGAAAAAPSAKPTTPLEPMPAWRAPGKLASLPPLKPLGLAGLTGAAAAGPEGDEASPPVLQRPWASLGGVRDDLPKPAMIALAAEAAAAAAAAGGSVDGTASAGNRAAAGAGIGAAADAVMSDASSRSSGGEDDEDSDDFGAAGQQQLFAAARRQLSQHSRAASNHDGVGEGGTQKPQLGGGAGVLVTGTLEARLTMSSSSSSSSGSSVGDRGGGGGEAAFEDDDDDGEGGLRLPEDISLPDMGLGDADDDYSGVFEAAPAAVGNQHQHPGSQGGGGRRPQPLRQHSELLLTEEDTSEVPLASAAGFAIGDDDF